MKIEITIPKDDNKKGIRNPLSIINQQIEKYGLLQKQTFLMYGRVSIEIYVHKTFGHIMAFGPNYRKERFQ